MTISFMLPSVMCECVLGRYPYPHLDLLDTYAKMVHWAKMWITGPFHPDNMHSHVRMVWVVAGGICFLAMSIVISGKKPTCDSLHSSQIHGSTPVREQAASSIIPALSQRNAGIMAALSQQHNAGIL